MTKQQQKKDEERVKAKYPWIVKWGKMMQSYDYYIVNECYRAEQDNAPFDAIYKRHNGGWARLSESPQKVQDELGFISI